MEFKSAITGWNVPHMEGGIRGFCLGYDLNEEFLQRRKQMPNIQLTCTGNSLITKANKNGPRANPWCNPIWTECLEAFP